MAEGVLSYVICYDIPSDRRRVRLAKLLDGYGHRVQYSVYEVVLSGALFVKLLKQIESIADAREDRVAFYPVCAACVRKRLMVGAAAAWPDHERVFVV